MVRDNESGHERRGLPPAGPAAERYPEHRPARRIVMVAFLVVAICGTMVPVLLANNGRNLDSLGNRLGLPLHDWWRGRPETVQLPPQHQANPTRAAPAPTGRNGDAAPDAIPVPAISTPPSLLSPPAEAWQPRAGCEALEPGANGEKPVFFQAPDGRSECTVLIAMSAGDNAASLFLQIRAAGENLSSLRMKLNFGADEETAALTRKAGDLAGRILAPISRDGRAYIEARMTERQAFRTDIGDYRMTFRAEGSDASRFNFIAVAKPPERASAAEQQQGQQTSPNRAQP